MKDLKKILKDIRVNFAQFSYSHLTKKLPLTHLPKNIETKSTDVLTIDIQRQLSTRTSKINLQAFGNNIAYQ